MSAKTNLITYAATDWPAYLGLTGQIIAVGGFFFFCDGNQLGIRA